MEKMLFVADGKSWKGMVANAKVSNVSQLLHQTAVDVERLVHALPELKQRR